MKKIILTAMSALTMFGAQSYAQQTGINTKDPGSILTVNGSIAADYKIITTNTTLGVNDHFVAYNTSNNNSTVTLPAAVSGSGNFKGRKYSIKNTGTGTLSILPSGSELIDGASDVGSIVVPPSYTAELISKGTTTGTTWEFSVMASTEIPKIISISPAAFVTPQGAAPAGANRFSVNDLAYTIVSNSSSTFTLPFAKPVFLNYGLGLDDFTTNGTATPYFKCELFLNGNATGLFLVAQQHSVGQQLQFSISGTLVIPAGTHTIDARMIRWFNGSLASGTNQNFANLSSVLSAVYVN